MPRRNCFALLACSLLASGCASTASTNENDPLEGFNRKVFAINDGLDRVALKPLAKGYQAITPDPLERGVSNVFANLGEPIVAINNLLQGKPIAALGDTGRFLLNSTVGIFGLFDVAKAAGLKKHDEDFGQTLAVWGVPAGPYLMLPLMGPATLRDSAGMAVDQALYPPNYFDDSSSEDKLRVLQIISLRAGLLSLDEQINQSSDRYLFLREAWLQRREYLIYDGNPPLEDLELDFDEDFDADL